MRMLILSDIHGNLAALEAVLDQVAGTWDQALCLGDMVGYGPDPNECIERVREITDVIIGGNHDLAAGGIIDLSDFAPHSRRAMEWTMPQLTEENIAFLSRLSPRTFYQGLLLSHGSPKDPIWGYILESADAREAFLSADFGCCCFAHTHIPVFSYQFSGAPPEFLPLGFSSCDLGYGSTDLSLQTGFTADPEGLTLVNAQGTPCRLLLNPGSVGFPRDDWDSPPKKKYQANAQYALFDTASGIWQFKRAVYDMRDTAKRMRKAGL